jgi:CheY-like chemotaxis protein
MSNGTRFLVIDSNRVYAKMVKGELERNVPDAVVDVATNIWETKRRIAEKQYDYVLADLSISMDEDEILEALSGIDVTVVKWAAVQYSSKDEGMCLQKPEQPAEMKEVLENFVLRKEEETRPRQRPQGSP